METVFATVIYREAQQYFDEFISSLMNQTNQGFDLLILNDNYTKEELSKLNIPDGAIVIDKSSEKLSIGMLRVELIKSAKSMGYKLMIMGDADDTFARTRIDSIKKTYKLDKSHAFYYNELITDSGESCFDYIPDEILNVRPISQGNFLGMSTTAINLDTITLDYIESLKEGDCNIFDWYLYSRLLMDIGTGKKVDGGETIYRIHDNNEVGMTIDVDREYRVKLEHYERLNDYVYFTKLKNLLETTDINKLDTSHSNHNYWWSNIYMEEHYEI